MYTDYDDRVVSLRKPPRFGRTIIIMRVGDGDGK
jgi:hypothetical protein